jgi:hypothetical protein
VQRIRSRGVFKRTGQRRAQIVAGLQSFVATSGSERAAIAAIAGPARADLDFDSGL